jgi:predicted Zn-dependent peptidase
MAVAQPRPVAGPVRPFTFPEFEESRLSCGTRLLVCHLPGRKLGSAELILEAGAVNEADELRGAAGLAASGLSEGTGHRDAFAFADELDKRGASFSASADVDVMHAATSAPTVHFARALELMAEAVLEPAFPEHEIKRLRDQRVNGLKQAMIDPSHRANQEALKAVYTPGSAYRRLSGEEVEAIQGMSRDDIAGFYGRFATPQSATLVIAADLGELDLAGALDRAFAGWSRPEPNRPDVWIGDGVSGSALTLVHRPGAVQSSLVAAHLGVERSHPDYFPLLVMLHIFGGGSLATRLNLKLREEKGYTYGAGGSIQFRRHRAPFAAAAGVQTLVTADALRDMLGEIRKLHDAGVTEHELEEAKRFLMGSWPLQFQSAGGVARALADLATHNLPLDYLQTYRGNLDAVTLDDVARVAREHIHPDRLAMVVVGDEEVVEAPLRSAGFAPLTVVHDAAPGSE